MILRKKAYISVLYIYVRKILAHPRLYTLIYVFFVGSSMFYIRLYTYMTKQTVHESYLSQNFNLANAFCTELKCMELNWSFVSQNNINNQFTFKRWKFTRKQAHLSHVVFLKTCPLWKCTKIAMTKATRLYCFFACQSQISTANKRKLCCFV